MSCWRSAALHGRHGVLVLVLATLLAACSSASKRPDPAPLAPNPNLLSLRQAWSTEIGEVKFPLVVQPAGQLLVLAASDGQVTQLDARTGEMLWRFSVGTPLSAGVGHDGRVVAVVTKENELVALQEGRELWRQRLPAASYTPPLVAGARVFVLGADRSVSAFDGQSGRRLWSQTRSGEALVLRQPGILMAVGDTLVVGLSGRLVGMQPLNGGVRWEVPVATPRGINDVERLVDLVAGVSRQGQLVCVRAFQAAVACVDAGRGTLVWSKPAEGGLGLQGDEGLIFGVEADGTLLAWQRSDGERAWSVTQLRWQTLTAPAVMGPTVLVGDGQGRLHFFARQDGALQHRLETDGSAIAATPVLLGNTLVVVNQNGRVFGLRPE